LSIIRNVISAPSSSLLNTQKNSTSKASSADFSEILSGYSTSKGSQVTKGSQASKGTISRSSKAKSLDDYRMQASPSRARAQRQKTTVATETRSVDSLNTETQVPEKLKEVIAESARKYDIPEKLLSAVIKVESNFNPRAVSSEGARGLMQLMPATARQLGVKNSFDIKQNVDAGSRYLKDMLDRYDGRIDLALAAYNAGPGAVDRYGGIPPYRETKGYVKKVMAYC